MRWVAIIWAIGGCGGGVGGDGDGGDQGDPFSAVFIFNGDRDGDTVLQGQVATPGTIGLASPSGCSNPAADEPIALASFLPIGSPDLMDIGDIALDGFSGLVIARPIDDTNLNYDLVSESVPYPPAGTPVSVRADDDRLDATLVIGQPPTVTSPADGGTFRRTEDLHFSVDAPGAAGIVIDMDFPPNGLLNPRAVCFFPGPGDLVVPGATLSQDTFALTGPVDVLVGSWTIGEGGSGGVDVHLVSIATAGMTLTLQE